MKRPRKINRRQIKHLLRAFKESGYYFKSLEKKEFKIDSNFLEGLQLFLFDSKGKNVKRVINAFRTVDDSFSDVGNTDFINNQIDQAAEAFLKKNLAPKEFKKAKKILNSGKKSEEIGMFPAQPYHHPQKTNWEESGLAFHEEEKDGFKIDFSLKLW